MRLPVYLDHHATTPVDPRVLDAMLPYFREDFGNPSSGDHIYGVKAADAVEEARRKVSDLIHSRAEEIVFTSGATESDNLAIMGVAQAVPSPDAHFITSSIEHKAVLDTFKRLESTGRRVTYLSVDQAGTVSPDALRHAMTPKTVLVSIMAANNEIGTIQDITKLSGITHEQGALFHTDAAQAVGHIPIDVDEAGIDLMSISAHKVYGPKGVGGLFVRKRSTRVRLSPIALGGGQERGLRSGTLNVPGIVGFGAALGIAAGEMRKEMRTTADLRDDLQSALVPLGGVNVNGNVDSRLPHNLNVRIGGVDGKALIAATARSVAFSASSACSTQTVEPSHVLLAIGYSPTDAHQCVRFGLGRFNNKEEIEFSIEQLEGAIRRLRRIAT